MNWLPSLIFAQRSVSSCWRNFRGFGFSRISEKCPRVLIRLGVRQHLPALPRKKPALAALNLPLKAILVEKPLGHSVASGRRILESVKRRNIPMATPHGLMVKRCPLEIIERTQNGEIGELKLIEIQSPAWDIMNAGIHWLHFSVNLNGHSGLVGAGRLRQNIADISRWHAS